MTRLGLTQRLARLEETATGGVPLYVCQWLGEKLTPEQTIAAAAEWDAVRTLPAPNPATIPSESRAWLATRGAA